MSLRLKFNLVLPGVPPWSWPCGRNRVVQAQETV